MADYEVKIARFMSIVDQLKDPMLTDKVGANLVGEGLELLTHCSALIGHSPVHAVKAEYLFERAQAYLSNPETRPIVAEHIISLGKPKPAAAQPQYS